MSKQPQQQKLPEAPKEAEKPATLCLGIGMKDGKYLIEEVLLGQGDKVLKRTPLRLATGLRVACGDAVLELEALIPEWQRTGLLS